MIGRTIGNAFSTARDHVARGLIRLGVTPNMLTAGGLMFTLGASVCYALGASADFAWSLDPRAPANAYLLLAGAALIAASACDMLDGAVARLGNLATPFGAFIDSTTDRFSDFAVYAGIALHYASRQPANLTMVLACMWAFVSAFMISYTRARAEDLIDRCRVGYWQRGERSAAILIGTFSYHIPALVAQQARLPMFTALRRITFAAQAVAGRTPPEQPAQGPWWVRIQPWRYRRTSLPYDLVTGANIVWLILADIPAVDLLRRLAG